MAPTVDTYHLKLTFFLSLTSIPSIYLLNFVFEAIDEQVRVFWMMVAGFVVLGGIGATSYFASKVRDALYCGWTVFAFTCVIDGVITLEYYGIASSFVSEYLKLGEPYLFSPWGSAICVVDIIIYYALYLSLVYLYSNKKSWRSVGLYWASTLIGTMFCYISAILAGRHSATSCTLLNIPHILFPIYVVYRIFKTQKRCGWNIRIEHGVLLALADVVLGIGFLASIWIISAKTYVLLGTEKQLMLDTVKYELALGYNDPAPFYSFAVFSFYFYVVPLQILSLYFLVRQDKPEFLWDVAVVQAAVMLIPQVSYIISSLDILAPAAHRVDWSSVQFWITNVLILLVPHLFLARMYLHRVSTVTKSRKIN